MYQKPGSFVFSHRSAELELSKSPALMETHPICHHFGSLGHVKVTNSLRELEDKSKEMVFVGYEHGSKAFRCLDHVSLKLCIGRDVIIEESKSLIFSVENAGISFSYGDFDLDVFQLVEEE